MGAFRENYSSQRIRTSSFIVHKEAQSRVSDIIPWRSDAAMSVSDRTNPVSRATLLTIRVRRFPRAIQHGVHSDVPQPEAGH